MTNKFISYVDGNRQGVASDSSPRFHRSDSLSVVSRQSVLSILLLCLTLFVGVGNVWANYTITFNGTNSESTAISTSTTAASITGSSSYVTGNVVTATKAYGATSGGIKLGTGSASGTIKVNLSSSGQVTPKKILVNCKLYNSNKAATLGVNGSAKQSIGSDYGNLSFTITSAITYIQLDVTKYAWVKYVRVVDCDAPTAVAKGTVTSSSVALTITDASNVDTYEVYYSTSPTAPNDGTTASTTVNTKTPTVTGLNANTTYYLWVRSKCSNTSKSDWCALTGSSFTTAAAAPSYTITAHSNNTNYGTVSLSGSVITGSPKSGYRYASPAYTVTSGTATVSQSGNAFTVNPSTNCTVTINFEPIPTHKISFNTGGLVDIADATGIQEGAVYNITQTPAASLTANCEYGTFVGWTTASSIASASVCPTIITSYEMQDADVTLHAVYSKTTSGGGNSGSVTITHNSTNFPTGYAAAADYELEGYTFNIKQIYKNGKMQWRSSTNSAGAGVMYNKDVFPAKITSVVVTYNNDDAGNNHTLKVGSSANPTSGTAITPTSDDLVYTFDCSAANADYFVLTNGEGMGSTSSVVINYGSSGTTTYNLAANCCDPLGSINGSVSQTNPTTAVLSWDAIANVSVWEVKYRTHGDGDWTKFIGEINTDGNRKSATITTVCDTKYDFEIITKTVTDGYCTVDTVLNNNGNGFDAGKYAINIAETSNGTVTSNVTTSCSGTNNVTLTISPNTGYRLSELIVASSDVTESVSNNTYTFSMPASDVAVSATFAAQHHNVVFHKNDGGEDVTSNQDFTYGVAQNLSSISTIGWSRTNYNFGGWMTDPNGTEANYQNGVSYTLNSESDINLYALWVADNTRTISYSGDTYIASYTSKPTSINIQSDNSFSVSFSLDDHYTLSGVAVKMGDEDLDESLISFDQESLTVTAPQGGFTDNISVAFTIAATNYTVNWYVNGTKVHEQTDVANTDYDEVPDDFSEFDDCKDGLTFIGWKEGAIDGGSTTSAPSLASIGTKITANKDYYAVFAEGTPGSEVWEKATTVAAGDYLIVCEDQSVAFDGSLSTLDAVGDTINVTIENGVLTLNNPAKNAENCVFTVASMTEGYSIKSASNKYIGNIGTKNGMTESENEILNQISISDGTATITSGTTNYLRYNKNSDQRRFRYFNTNSQTAIQLYKKTTTAANWTKWYTTCPHYYTISLTNDGIVDGKGSFVADKASALAGESVTLTATGTENAGQFNSWSITNVDLTEQQATTTPLTITMPANDITVSATFDALYAITKDEQNGTITLGANYAAAGDEVTISAEANPQYKNPVLTVFETATPANIITVSDGKFTMPACGVTARVVCAPALDALVPPTLGTEVPTYQGVTLNWTGVSGNEGYVLTVKQGGVNVPGFVDVAIAKNATSYTIASGLAANTDYTYSIYTKGNGTTTMEVNTPANGNFSTVDYPNVTFYYSENGTLSAGESKKILTDFELADPVSDPCTKKFVGWSTETVAETDVEPAMMAPGATYQIPTNANCTIYAVYATEVPGAATQWTIEKADLEVLDSQQSSAYDKYKGDQSKSGITYNIADVMPGATQGHSGDLQIKKSSGKLYNKTAFNKDIISIVITGADISVFEGTSEISSTPASGAISATGSGPYTYTFSSGKRYFHIQNATNSAAYPSSITVNVAGSTTYAAYATTCTGKVATPSFSGVTDGETYEEDKTVSLGCATGEATIRYTMSNDGTTPADPTGESTAATSISLNTDGVYVIKAKAFKDGMDASDVATISVTINKPCTTIASFIAAKPSTAKKLVFTAESNAVVLGVNANRIYIQDPTGGLLLYKTAHEKTWTKGKKVVGTVIGTYAEADNAPRMLVTDFGETEATIDGEIPSAVVIEGAINAENFAANRNKLVTISDLHFQAQSVGGGNSINITRGDDTYQIYNAFNALTEHVLPLTETACSVTGILGYHSNKYQLMPIDANCITTGATATLPEFVGETGGADAGHRTEVASGEVIKLTAAEGMTTKYRIGENAPVTITTNTEAVISGANDDLIAITISASREYYATNSVTYYYKINNALTKYIITSAVAENGTFKVKNSDASAEITSAVAGATVTLVAEPTHTETAQYSLDHWTVYETGNTGNTVSVENNQFEMPSFAVTVSATFAEDAYATVVFDGGDATGTAPAGGKKYVGQEVTMPNKGALVKADHVLASWTYNETEYAVGDTYEIQAGDAAIEGNEITFTANWTPYPWANGGDWTLVKNADELTVGSYVIIAASNDNKAMKSYDSGNNCKGKAGAVKTGDMLKYDSEYGIFEIQEGTKANTISFFDVKTEAYLFAASSSNNQMKAEATLSDNSSWTKSVTAAGLATLTAQGANTRNEMRYNPNNGSPIFACYASNSETGTIVALYKYYAPVPKVTYDKNTEDEVTNMPNPSVQRTENNKATIAAGPSRTGYTFEGWKNGNTTYTVGEEYTFTEDITLYAQWAALPSFHVTYNTSGSQGTTPTDATNYYEGDEVTLASASGLSNAGYFFAGWNDGTSTYPAGGEYTMPGSNVTFTAVWSRESAQKWALVKQGDELEINGEYIIASTVDAKTYALGDITTMGSNKVGQPLHVDRNGDIVKGSEAMVVYTLVAGNGDNTYAFKNSDNDYLMWSSGNTLNKTNELNNTSSWKISIGDGNIATIKNVSDETRKMQYNSSQPRFACYSSTGQKDVQLFKKVALAEISTSVDASTLSDNTDVIIREGGVLNVNNDKTIGDLTVENGGQVVLAENKLTVVGTFTIETTMASGTSGQLTGATASNFAANGPAYIDITLGANGTNQQWHAFTVPFPVDVMNGIYDLNNEKLYNEVNYAIMEYHGDERAKGNYGWKKIRTTLVPGTFYIMATDGYRTTYRFKKKAGAALVAANSKPIYEYPLNGGTEADKDNGWNGLGNPNLFYGKVDLAVQVLDPESYTYVTKTANSTNFVVGTPFFYQATADGSMVMETADASANYAPARVQANEIKDVPVSFGNKDFTDYLYVSANEDALSTYETGKDLVKMTMTNTPSVAQIFGKAYNSKLSMVYTPIVNNQAEVALELYAPQAGEYTIGAPSMDNADLYLTQDGAIIWNLSMSAYELSLNKGLTNNYGLLLIKKAPGIATGVDEIGSEKAGVQKIVLEDKVFILRGGKMYDVTGKAVK